MSRYSRTVLPAAGELSVEHLRSHLVHEHHRSGHELVGTRLLAVHLLEHVDDDLGMLALDHTHAG